MNDSGDDLASRLRPYLLVVLCGLWLILGLMGVAYIRKASETALIGWLLIVVSLGAAYLTVESWSRVVPVVLGLGAIRLFIREGVSGLAEFDPGQTRLVMAFGLVVATVLSLLVVIPPLRLSTKVVLTCGVALLFAVVGSAVNESVFAPGVATLLLIDWIGSRVKARGDHTP